MANGLEIFKLFGSIYLKDADVVKKLDGIDQKAGGVAGKLENMVNKVEKWGKALAAGFAVERIYNFIEGVTDAASAINDMSVRTGLSTKTLQELQFATGQAGVEFNSITTAVTGLTKAMSGAEEGSGKVKQAFTRLGVSTEVNGQMRQMNDIFMETVMKLADMQNKTERNQLALTLLGRSSTEIVPLLDQGSAGIKKLSDKAHELGLVMTDESISAADEFGDNLDALKETAKALVNQVGMKVIPVLNDFATYILNNFPTVVKVIEGLTAVWLIQKSVLAALAINKALNWVADQAIAFETAAVTKGTIAYTVAQKANAAATGIATIANTIFGTSMGATSGYILLVAAAIAVVVGLLLLLTKGFQAANSEIKNTVNSAGGLSNLQLPNVNQYSTTRIPGLANGGTLTSAGRVLVGERGPELLDLPQGATVTPLDNGGTNNFYGDVIIPAKDIEEMKNVTDFFKRIKQVSRQGV